MTEGKSTAADYAEHVAFVLRRAGSDEPAKCSSKMTRILKASVQSRIDDADPGISETLLGAFDPLRQHVVVGRAAGTLTEQFGEVVRTHAGDRRKLRQAKIRPQIGADIIKHPLETMSWQTATIGSRDVAPTCVPLEKIDRQRVR